MRVINEISVLIDTLRTKKNQNKVIGLVPTMGALHEGHLELIQKAKEECDIVVCSIYVNPTQFNNIADLKTYPRAIKKDIAILDKQECTIVFCPSDEEMYAKEKSITIEFGALGKVLEGKYRQGHFNGVGLIVSKLFNVVKPDVAYFGQKDLQQFAIINALVNGLNFNIELRCIPTIRSMDGLALSSRNTRLTKQGKQKALLFYQSLSFAKAKLIEGAPIEFILNEVKTLFEKSEIDLEYFEIVNKNSFEQISTIEGAKNVAICVAGSLEGVRLIDNMVLN